MLLDKVNVVREFRTNKANSMSRYSWAPSAYRRLNGLLCVYKPAEVSTFKMVERIQGILARDLNALPCYKVESVMRKVDPNADFLAPVVVDSSSVVPSDELLEHRLILGQRYIPSDIKANHIHGLNWNSSGVVLVGLGQGVSSLELLSLSRFLRVYHVKGRFGWATHDFSPTGKIIEKTSYRHILSHRLDKVIASIQSSHLRRQFDYAGVLPHSQAAYELAAQGLVRPIDGKSPPMIYRIKCIDFQLPDFTLEIHSINEYCDYFMEMIHDIAINLKSTAVCTGIRRLRYGPFGVSHALLRQQWNLEEIVDNMKQNARLLVPDKLGESNIKEIGDIVNKDTRKQIEG